MYFLIEDCKFLNYLSQKFEVKPLGITIFSFIFLKGKKEDDLNVFNHEMIHIKQFQETLYFGFYFISFFDLIIKFIKHKSFYNAYRNLMFEVEAYDNMYDLDYLNKRQKYAWLKNIFTTKNKVHPQ